MTKDESPILSLSNVAVSYRRKKGLLKAGYYWALKDVSFNLYHGETLGIIGRNGAGKSTLLMLLADIIQPDRGEIMRTGAKASLLTLNAGLIPHLSGRNNAILSGMLLGMRRKVIEGAMDKIIEFSELEEFIDEPVKTYSAGMRARLGFSVAFQADPDILLIDETLGVGDARFSKKSSGALRKKIRSNKTVVLVSHNARLVRNLCDRVVWIDKGRSVEEGQPGYVLDAYLKNSEN